MSIKIVGVGDAGGSALNRIAEERLIGVECVAVNTNALALATASTRRVLIGESITHGLGTGGSPDWGRRAAEQSAEALYNLLEGAGTVYIIGGLGGGTCTGAAPVIAQIAGELGAMTVSIVTRPFTFEGTQRQMIAERGASALTRFSKTLVIVDNDRVLSFVEGKKTKPLDQAFALASGVVAWQVLARLI